MIYFFGDSFSVGNEFLPDSHWKYPTWSRLLSMKLNQTTACYSAMFGVSNEWIYNEFITQTEKFKPGDYVIIQPTASHRKWLFEDRPHLSNIFYSNVSEAGDLTKDEKKALNGYMKYLHFDKIDSVHYTMLINAFYSSVWMIKNVNFCILPGWHGALGINGCLNNVCSGEFENQNAEDTFYKKYGIDPRPNHMSKNNHKILADKIYNFFTKGEPIDLTTGFEQKIITTADI